MGVTPAAAVLAVDAGNSKTDVALVGQDGTVLGSARGGGSSGKGVSGSGLRPSARSSASSGCSSLGKRRASAFRGTPARSPISFSPSRTSMWVASGDRRKAATGSGASTRASSSGWARRRMRL